MSGMDLMRESPEPHDEPPSKRQKIAGENERTSDEFENGLTAPIALELGGESRDLEFKLLEKCLASSRCDIAQPAKCQCRSCLYTTYGHIVFVPHNGYQDGGEGPGERCSECVGVEGTVRGQYAVEISDHLPLSPEVRHDLACHFRVFKEVLSKMFSTTVQDLRKRMIQVKIESMPSLNEEMLRLREEIKISQRQLDALAKELNQAFKTMVRSGVDPLEMGDVKMKEGMASLVVGLRKPSKGKIEDEIERLKMENARLGRKVQQLEEENTDLKRLGAQSVPIKLFTSD